MAPANSQLGSLGWRSNTLWLSQRMLAGRSQLTFTGPMGQAPFLVRPNYRLSCLDQQFFWERLSDTAPSSILRPPLGQKTDLCRVHRVSQCRQIKHYQHTQEEKGLHCCANTWRNQNLAIYHSDEADLLDRLSRCCSRFSE